MIDELIYHEYAGFKKHYEVLIEELELSFPVVYFRLENHFKVLDYFYDQLIDNQEYSETEDFVFKVGFNHLEEIIKLIDNIYKNNFDNNFKEMVKFSKEINYLVIFTDYLKEVEAIENFDKDLIKILKVDIDNLKELIKNKAHLNDEQQIDYDVKLEKIALNLPENFKLIIDVFEEIVDSYNL